MLDNAVAWHILPWHTPNTVCLLSAGKIHVRNTIEQLKLVGPRSMGVSLLTAGFVGMVFTIQVPCLVSTPLAGCAC